MYKVMLADDNKFALAHFVNMIKWEDFGFTLVSSAIDGIEAWEEFCKYSPDLVITDVQMPGLSGIELAGKIKEKRQDTVVIFLSSYDEFDYARSAIDLNVREYILKQELDRALLEKKLREIKEDMDKKKEKQNKVLTSHIRTLFQTEIEELDDVYFSEYEEKEYACLIFEQDHVPEFLSGKSGVYEKEADYKELIPRLKERTDGRMLLFRVSCFQWICLLSQVPSPEQTGRFIQKLLYEEYDLSFSVYFFGEKLSLWQCRQEYEKSKYIFEQRYFEGMKVFMFSDMYEKPEICRKMQKIKGEDLFSGEETDIAEKIDELFRPVLYSYDFEYFKELVTDILTAIENIVPGDKMKEIYNEEILYLCTVKRMIRWIKSKCKLAEEYISPKAVSDYYILQAAEDFIYKEYGNPFLSVEDVAKKAGVSVNWLNDLFKKEQKETAGKFLTKVRMEKTKELLENGESKMGEIASKTGYNSASYWAKVFKKTYGLSPQEYYEKMKRGK